MAHQYTSHEQMISAGILRIAFALEYQNEMNKDFQEKSLEIMERMIKLQELNFQTK